ncbi:MAG: hypothetical protein Q7S87_09310 [Agitococcus sp.]|nr:hypothetical protein [Agitococcus sp.]MDO9178964.1 hypothetical protein [Agitococcus sp.]
MGWIIFALVVLAVSGAIFSWWRQHAHTTSQKHHPVKKHPVAPTHGKYHCVTVQGDNKVCAGIQQLLDKSLLPHEAPTLPLATCDMQPCKCHYIHHEDRRLRTRREPFGELNGATLAATDRPLRARVDRRKAVKPS